MNEHAWPQQQRGDLTGGAGEVTVVAPPSARLLPSHFVCERKNALPRSALPTVAGLVARGHTPAPPVPPPPHVVMTCNEEAHHALRRPRYRQRPHHGNCVLLAQLNQQVQPGADCD